MKNLIFTKKISIKLLLTIPVCLFLAVVACLLFSRYFVLGYVSKRKETISVTEYNIIAIGIFIIGMMVFIFSFLLIINKEIKYIKYIANQVQRVADEDFGLTLEIRGNDELAELCTNINLMSIELKNRIEKERTVEKTKTELITNVSHDLRTPLTAIIGYLDILKSGTVSSKEEEKEYLNSTYNLSNKLKMLIDELFEYTKLSDDEVKLELSEVDICSILNQIIGEYMPIFERKDLSIISQISDIEILTKIDVEKMVRVFDNILRNAEKYSYSSSDIIINIENKDESALISFSNRVEHTPQDNLDKMFERFYRVDTSRSSNVQGSGLGLAISKKIIELHNGEIWAEYHGDIITFKIKLPIVNKNYQSLLRP